jgi:hypothetical protein
VNANKPEPVDTKSLYIKVKAALDEGGGKLDISNCEITETFDLEKLILAHKEKVSEDEIQTWKPRSRTLYPTNVSLPKQCVQIPFEINARHTVFNCEVLFMNKTGKEKEYYFEKKVDFFKSHFQQKVRFASVTFQEEITFDHAEFNGRPNDGHASTSYPFNNNSFKKEVSFYKTIFTHETCFYNCSFEEKTDFTETDFVSKASFENTTFAKHTSFKKIKIQEKATLHFDHITTHDYFGIIPSVFKGEIIIKDPTLESDRRSLVLDFKDCYQDKGKATFEGVEIDNDRTCLKVRNLPIGSKVTVDFEKCGFYGKSVAFTDVYMKQVSITGGNYVSGMAFYHCEWVKYNPYYVSFKWHYIFLDMFLMRGFTFKALLKDLILIYAHLKKQAVEAGDTQLSNDFHFWQQYFQGQLPENKRFSWNQFYLYTSAYGTSVRLPLIWFICVIGIFTLFYALLTKVPQPTLMFAFRTSIENSLPLIRWTRSSLFNTHPTPYLLLSILQHLIQGYLLFQIGAAIRNKVKR